MKKGLKKTENSEQLQCWRHGILSAKEMAQELTNRFKSYNRKL